MVDFNIKNALQRRFNQQNINQAKINVQSSAVNPDAGNENSTQNIVKKLQNNLINNLQQQIRMPQNVRMNHLASVDRSIYIKNLLKLPDNMTDLLMTFGNDKTEAQMKEALKQNQQFLDKLNNTLQQNQNKLNMQEFIQNQRNNIQQNQQNQIQQGQQNQGQNQNNINQQPQPNQNLNNQPQVQPPYVAPNEKNNNTGDKVQQNPNQNQQNQNGKQEQNDIKQPQNQNRLPNNPNDAFDKTMQEQIKNNNQKQPQQTGNDRPQGEVNKPAQNGQGQINKPNQNPQNPNLPNNKPNIPNRPNVPNQPLPPQQPNIPNRPNIPNQPLPPQQPNVPNRPNIPNQPLPPQQPNVPNRPNVPNQPLPPQQPNVPNQPLPPQQPNIPNRPNVPNQPLPPQQPNIPNRPNVPNQPLPPQQPNVPNRPNVPNQPAFPQPRPFPNPNNNPIKDFVNDHFKNNRINTPTGGAGNINDTIQEPEFSKPSPMPTPANVNHRLHSQLMNNARFEQMSNLRDSVRNHIRRPIEVRHQAPTEQLQEEVSQELKQLQAQEVAQLAQKEVSAKVLPSRINLSVLNSQIQQHSKQALNNLVLEMSTATRQGITDTKPIQETISLINSSISASSQNDTALAIKNLMLLYLPWLPLEEGVGFKLDVETKKAEPPQDDDTSISIMITTKNYGNISAVINLITTNSVDIFITCDKTFPKDELLKRLNQDSKEHAMTASIGIEQTSQHDALAPEVQKAKVNLSNVTTINPYLLLMSHSFIRHAIEIDINTTMYGQNAEL